jgi:copper(I)-binding protein
MYRRVFFSLLVALLILSACASPAAPGPKISVESAWARPAATGPMSAMGGTPEMPGMSGMSGSETNSAVYFVIVNEGSEADTLIGASSDVASNVELHETRIQGDVAEMAPVARVDVPARGSVEFKPGGYHVMLVGLKQDLKEGDTLKLTLRFEKSGEMPLDVPVRLEQ